MKRHSLFLCLLLLLAAAGFGQVPIAVGVQILKAEDSRRYDDVLRNLLTSPNAKVRERAALAAGRIGDDKAVIDLAPMLTDSATPVRAMAAFAIGEVESIKGADTVILALNNPQITHAEIRVSTKAPTGWFEGKVPDNSVSARLVEAAGKIAAANAKDPKTKELGAAILNVLDGELKKQSTPSIDVIRLGLTGVLRAKPAGGDEIVRKFLAFHDPDVVCDALNTLARLRAKNANRDARDLLETSLHALIRANAARLLGVADDKEAFDLLLKAATTDADSRVRVSAIRSLGNLKDVKAAGKLLDRGEKLLADCKISKFANPSEKSEMIEIATVLGRLLAGTADSRAVKFLDAFVIIDDARTPEISVARMRVEPGSFENTEGTKVTWHQLSTGAQLLAELAAIESKNDKVKEIKTQAPSVIKSQLGAISNPRSADDKRVYAVSDFLSAYARFKTADLDEVLRANLLESDVQSRTTAASLLADRPVSKENVTALKEAFNYALLHDKTNDDAQLATLNALYKLDKKESVGTLLIALSVPDYLVRKRAFELLADKDLQNNFPGIPTSLENARAKHKDQVLPYTPAFGTKLGQVLNTDLDYRRALLRKNGSVKAVLTTQKGVFTIVFTPEEAPLTVDNWVKLARTGYFNGLEVHRVVANFVMQDGDPRGDGNGGPGWSIRCEINMLPFDRGAVGMALSGKDTGGSQWFVDHSPQPHLDGGYTVFGHVNETDMKVVDNIVRGDKIISVKIVEAGSLQPQRH